MNVLVAANDQIQQVVKNPTPPEQTGGVENANPPGGNEGQQQAVQQPQQQAEGPNGPWEPQQYAQARRQRDDDQQAKRNRQEYNARAANNSIQYQVQNGAYGNFDPGGNYGGFGPPAATNESTPSVMHAVWFGEGKDQLVLARRVGSGTARPDSIEGCWVDWPGVRTWLLRGSADLLPDAKLEPVIQPQSELSDARLLASLPVRLIPGKLPPAATDGSSPLRISLVVAWTCVLLASAAVAGLLRGVVSLSERRGAFVSAVTHELRTPLTTLRMYTEMLEGGMVEDDEQRRHYLGTLRAEADRLGHLVENVLAYSRLERRRDPSSEVIESPLASVLRRPLERLSERARQGGMTLHVDLPDDVAATRVRANPTSLEQILFNLVDNACKYAAGSENATINFSATRTDGTVRLTVRDHGPGIPTGREARMFKPFSKSVQEAANSAPGLGLGLALSKRLARAMDGRLDLDPDCRDGACFVLTLPLA